MIRAETITLIGETPEAHGIHEQYTATRTDVYAEIHSVTRSESYQALSAGLSPEIVFVLTDYADYDGQKIVEWAGVEWNVVRTYVNGQSIEIVVERGNRK